MILIFLRNRLGMSARNSDLRVLYDEQSRAEPSRDPSPFLFLTPRFSHAERDGTKREEFACCWKQLQSYALVGPIVYELYSTVCVPWYLFIFK